jgi:hypothetical protein
MPRQAKPPVTRRAYTLRLRGADPQDTSWRNALWQTHEAVNKGAKAFGDWLLTLRGGLDYGLADAKVRGTKGKPDSSPTHEERRGRRILLALSWLTVESKLGAPSDLIIATGEEAAEERNSKVVGALEEILRSRGMAEDEINAWRSDCATSLSAAIRDDAVWVNRSTAFDAAVHTIGSSLTREEAWDMLEGFFGSREAYLAPVRESEDESTTTGQEDEAKDLVRNSSQWLSSRFGTGKGADFARMAAVYERITTWAQASSGVNTGNEAVVSLARAIILFNPASPDLAGILALIGGPGHKSGTRSFLSQLAAKTTVTQQDLQTLKDKAGEDAEKCGWKTGSKGRRAYSDAILKDVESVCGFTYLADGGPARHSEFAVLLDHAARRVSLAHTWIKRAEAERRKFEKDDAQKKESIPDVVRAWLDDFCSLRSGVSGAIEQYRIRRRAIDGWKEVVTAWGRHSCSTHDERIAAARELQDDPEIQKFGDIQLFEALAQDDAVCVWHKDGDSAEAPDPQPLLDYVIATEAEFKKRHFKVPAYRHPDALLHPVFCDFGKSRWDISFAVHKGVQSHNPNALSMTLWTGSVMEPQMPLCWQSKRLTHDLALEQSVPNGRASEVTRADRLGRAAANVTKSGAVKIAELFEQADWNGRLQAPRDQLNAIAAVRDDLHFSAEERMCRIFRMKDRIRWSVTFSAKLQPRGPWCDFAETLGLQTAPQYWPHADENKARKGHARLILARLPGLRVLSVDLGHRYAAACAVWEALSAEQVEKICKAANRKAPDEAELYMHLEDGNRAVVYRRIGANALPDGKPHPAPWARLDRQFLIRLQGEEKEAREASNEEIWSVHQMEAGLGRAMPLIDRLARAGWGSTDKQRVRLEALRGLGWRPISGSEAPGQVDMDDSEARKPMLSVDVVMSSTARTLRLALKRHGDRARITSAMMADCKPVPGGRKYFFGEAEDASANDDEYTRRGKHIEFIQDALLLWHGLTSSRGWRDDAAQRLWEGHIVKLPGYRAPAEIGEDASGVERKKRQEQCRDRLCAAAEALVGNGSLRKILHQAWRNRWEEDDGTPAEVDKKSGRKLTNGTGWHVRLRWMQDWLMPSAKQGGESIRQVGGLSLIRLATLTEYRRKVQVGFFTRLRPDGTTTETREQFGQSALDALEHLREQRVKQLASRIAEAALGIGRISRPKGGKDPRRPRARVDVPCHAVVIENLTHYRPEETRTRRENRQLMNWSAAKVKKYLSEACQLNGLHLRDVPAGYTSRQDSRTGAPGIRCQDVPVMEFMRSPFWRKQVVQAQAKQAENKGDARERFLDELNGIWEDKTEAEWRHAGAVRVPLKGGEVFVSANPESPAAKGLQADLNAAANIGLRALTDPDWPGKWWYVPCDPISFKPATDKVKGGIATNPDKPLKDASVDSATGRGGKAKSQSREVTNLWRDVSSRQISAGDGPWEIYATYQNQVQARVVEILRRSASPRISRENQ